MIYIYVLCRSIFNCDYEKGESWRSEGTHNMASSRHRDPLIQTHYNTSDRATGKKNPKDIVIVIS